MLTTTKKLRQKRGAQRRQQQTTKRTQIRLSAINQGMSAAAGAAQPQVPLDQMRIQSRRSQDIGDRSGGANHVLSLRIHTPPGDQLSQ
jgi:hypothetical protein